MQEPEEKKIALELLETEQAYVNRLHLLDQVSWGAEGHTQVWEAIALLPSGVPPPAQLSHSIVINQAGPWRGSTHQFSCAPQQGLDPVAVPGLSSGHAQARVCLLKILEGIKLYR